jgi:hypothetical protein
MNPRLETRLLAMGVRESIYHMTGRVPRRTPTAIRLLPWIVVVIGAAMVIFATQ